MIEPGKLNEYSLYMESQKEAIIQTKVLELGRIYVRIGEEVTHVYSDNDVANQIDILYFDKHKEVPITEEYIIGRLRRTHPSIEYIYFEGIYLDSKSIFTEDSMNLYTYIINMLNACKCKTEEFTEYVNYNITSIMLELD